MASGFFPFGIDIISILFIFGIVITSSIFHLGSGVFSPLNLSYSKSRANLENFFDPQGPGGVEFSGPFWNPARLFINLVNWAFVFAVPVLYGAIYKFRRAHAVTTIGTILGVTNVTDVTDVRYFLNDTTRSNPCDL